MSKRHWFVAQAATLCLILTGGLSASAADAAKHMSAHPAQGQVMRLDESDQAGMQRYQALLNSLKLTKQNAPALYKAKRTRIGIADPSIQFLGVSTDDGGTVSAQVLVVPPKPTHMTTVTLVLYDASRNVISTKNVSDGSGGDFTFVASDPGANPGKGGISALITVAVVYPDGTPGTYYSNPWAGSFPQSVENIAPAPASGSKVITTCVDMTLVPGTKTACTYVQATVSQPPNVKVPVKGTATFAAPIDVTAAGKPDNASATLMIVNPEKSTVCKVVDIGDRFFADPDTVVDGKTLKWTLDPADFGASCPSNNASYDFVLTLMVSVNKMPAWATVTSLVSTATKTTRAIPKLTFYAGCIAAGSKIAMADGRLISVEQVRVGDTLKGGTRNLPVAAVAKGENLSTVTFTTDDGHKLQVSLIHPVITARGAVQAQTLRLGDTIKTADGKTVKVVKIVAEVLTTPAKVYDLVLAPANVDEATKSTLFANGLLVGDGAMKISLENQGMNAARKMHTEKMHTVKKSKK